MLKDTQLLVFGRAKLEFRSAQIAASAEPRSRKHQASLASLLVTGGRSGFESQRRALTCTALFCCSFLSSSSFPLPMLLLVAFRLVPWEAPWEAGEPLRETLACSPAQMRTLPAVRLSRSQMIPLLGVSGGRNKLGDLKHPTQTHRYPTPHPPPPDFPRSLGLQPACLEARVKATSFCSPCTSRCSPDHQADFPASSV